MRKSSFLLSLLALLLASCASTSQNACSCRNSMSKHEVDISLSNYETYFDVTKTYNSEHGIVSRKYIFAGCLSYAFYENVVVSFNVTYLSGGSTSITLKLNANGNGTTDAYAEIDITAISGKGSYWF